MKLRCIVWTTITAGLLAHIAMGAEQKGTDTYGGWTPYQFALWNPVQIFGKTRDVYGLRTSIFYGKNRDVYGLDISLFTNSSRNVYGISILGFGNEYYHVPIKKGDMPVAPLIEVILDNRYDVTFISESPLLEHDAVYLRLQVEKAIMKRTGNEEADYRDFSEIL